MAVEMKEQVQTDLERKTSEEKITRYGGWKGK
jgi:hypothetical protein